MSKDNYYKRGYGSYGIGIRRTPKLYIVDRDIGEEIRKLQGLLLQGGYNFNLRYEKMIKNYWAIAIYNLAEYYSKIDLGDNYENVLLSIKNELLRTHENVTILSMILELSKYKEIRPDIINKFGKYFRDILVANGSYLSNKATYHNALSRASGFLSGIATVLGGIGKLIEHSQNIELTKVIVNSIYMDLVIYDIKYSNLYSVDKLLRDCVNDLEYIERNIVNVHNDNLIRNAAEMTISTGSSIILSTATAGVLGGPAGIVVGIAAGITISTAFGLLKEAEEYYQYYGIASLLYTLAYYSDKNYRLTGASIHLANEFMDTKVVGKLTKFSTSNPFEIILNFQEDYTETEKWNNYLDNYFTKKKIPIIGLVYSSEEGKLFNKLVEYVSCIKKVEYLNSKINYITKKQIEFPFLPIIMWLCSLIALILIVDFIYLIILKRFSEAFRNLLGGLLGESLSIALILYIFFGGSLRDKFYASLGIMSAKVIEASSFITKEIFGREMFKEETIEVVYLVYKFLENPNNIEKIIP